MEPDEMSNVCRVPLPNKEVTHISGIYNVITPGNIHT